MASASQTSRLALPVLLLAAACTGTSLPDTADTAPVSATTELPVTTETEATAATEAPVTTTASPPTTTAPAEAPVTTAPATTAPADNDLWQTQLANIDAATAILDEAVDEMFHAFDTGGLKAVAEAADAPETPSGRFVFVVDGSGEIVVHHREELIGASIAGELGHDMYGYPWHEHFAQLPPDGDYVVMMSRRGSHNAIAGPADAEAGLSVFDDYRSDLLMYRHMVVVPRDGYRFVFVATPLPAGLVNWGTLHFAAFLIGGGADVEAAGDTVIAMSASIEALAHAGRWHGDNSGVERFVGFVADPDGLVVNSRFDPTTVGESVADMLGPEALSSATAEGARYRDDSLGVDVTLLSTPQGYVVGGGVTGR